MADKFVDLEALIVRSVPVVSPSTRIGILHLGQRVKEKGPHEAGWVSMAPP